MSDSIKGIVKCDAPGCGWESPPDTVLKEWAHRKCPQCNHPLMDDEDRGLLTLVNGLFALGIAKNAASEDANFHIDTSKGKQHGTKT